MPYATASDYAVFQGKPADTYDADELERARIDAGLLRAEDNIRDAIRTQFYDANDAAVTTALTRATCEQFDAAEESGDPTGAAAGLQAAKIGSVSLGFTASSMGGRAIAVLAPNAVRILRAAGLLSAVVGVIN